MTVEKSSYNKSLVGLLNARRRSWVGQGKEEKGTGEYRMTMMLLRIVWREKGIQ